LPREKWQRPTVYPTGTREKLWKVEYREYFTGPDGKQHSRHKSKTWSRANFTKTQAQAECDKMMRALQMGGPKADGSMSLAAFWDEIYYPIRSRRWSWNTRKAVGTVWKLHIKPAFGTRPLKDIAKSAIELHLGRMADEGYSKGVVASVGVRLHSIFDEALDNDFIAKNPARKISIPPCRASPETVALTEQQVRVLWDSTEGQDYLIWRILLMTGARIGEVLALTRADVLAEGLLIDETAVNGSPGPTKNRKARVAPLCDSLRAELAEYLPGLTGSLLFTTTRGLMHRRNNQHIEGILTRARAAVPGLTFRQCRTTFATLFEGELVDVQGVLGHHSPEFTLKHYRKPITARQQGAVEALDGRLRKVIEIKKAG
jgi:integrase